MSCHRFALGTHVLLTEDEFPRRRWKVPFTVAAHLPSGRGEPWYLIRNGETQCLAAEHQIDRQPVPTEADVAARAVRFLSRDHMQDRQRVRHVQ